MQSILKKAFLPGMFALAMMVLVASFGSSVRPAYAAEGDICAATVGAQRGEAAPVLTHDGQGNDVYALEFGTTYGLVFRVEDQTDENVTVRIDSETGSALIISKAEILDVDGGVAEVGHVLIKPGVLTQTVDVIHPIFNEADGDRIGLNDWLFSVSYSGFNAATLANSVCGVPFRAAAPTATPPVTEAGADGWGFIDFECVEAGYFWVDILAPDDTEETGMSIKFHCEGQADTATIAASPTTVETVPALSDLYGNPLGIPANVSQSLITVTVLDQNGDRIDGVEVTFTTTGCRFLTTLQAAGPGMLAAGRTSAAVSPAGGGTTVDTQSDTDTVADVNFLTNNPLETEAGTAEVVLECAGAAVPAGGVATVTAIVERPGADIVLTTQVTVIGPVGLNGLTLTLNPTSLQCGNPVVGTVTALDSQGRPVSPGTRIFITTDTSSGVVGGGILGSSGAQGVTVIGVGSNGIATFTIATDPGNPGPHTVTAHAIGVGGVLVQSTATYTCTSPAQQIQIVGGGQAPSTTAPSTGTGTGTGATGTITAPRTGDAGMAAASGSNASLFVIAGAVIFALAGVASVRFARR